MQPGSPQSQEEAPAAKLHSGIQSKEEWERLKDYKNRPHAEELSRDHVRDIILDPNPVHPFKRIMVPVASNAFRWACKIVTGNIFKGKLKKKGVIHFECCNLIWIGKRPRQCYHSVNCKLRGQLDMRAQTDKSYNPTFIPLNLAQYQACGATREQVEKRVFEHVMECQETATAASTQAEESESEEEDPNEQASGIFIG